MSDKVAGCDSHPPVTPTPKPNVPTGGLHPQALAAAGRRVRADRARVHREISSRKLDPLVAAEDPLMAGDRWLTFLKSVPGIGQRGAYRILLSLGVRDDARLRTTGRRQRECILKIVQQRYRAAIADEGVEAA